MKTQKSNVQLKQSATNETIYPETKKDLLRSEGEGFAVMYESEKDKKCKEVKGEKFMPVVKVIEVLAQSEKGWEDAAQKALDEASTTIRNIQSMDVKDFQVIVHDNKIAFYRIDAKISFLLERE